MNSIKYKLSILLFLCSTGFWSCTDKCQQTSTYRTFQQVSIGQETLKNSISYKPAKDINNPGKLYAYQDYVYIIEVKKGIHVINNTDPSAPKKIGFVEVPGILDLAAKDGILYVDNYTDLVALDINNPSSIKEVGRAALRFNYGLHDGQSWSYDPFSKVIYDTEPKWVTENIRVSCESGVGIGYPEYYNGGVAFDSKAGTTGSSGKDGSGGTGGSMARFTVYDNYLYAATQSDLLVFSLKNPIKPDSINKVNLGWGIETIFPYQDKLFIGSNTGMHIFNNANPAKPSRLSIFQHARACDPVVVEGNRAYVTLRQGFCGAAPNQLDIIDINNLSSPKLIKSYTMENPHGLSVLDKKLSLCEGKFGLKSYDVSSDLNIKLMQHIKNIDAFDVIQLPDQILLMIGKDGFYQYNNADPSSLKLLSKIPVVKN
jgi:hypothetical protein